MTVTINDCIAIYQAIEAIKKSNDLEFTFAWSLDDIQQSLKTHVERGEKEQMSLLKKLGVQDIQNPDLFNISPENRPQYIEAINKIMSYNVEVEIKPIAFEDFKKAGLTIPKGTGINVLQQIITK